MKIKENMSTDHRNPSLYKILWSIWKSTADFNKEIVSVENVCFDENFLQGTVDRILHSFLNLNISNGYIGWFGFI